MQPPASFGTATLSFYKKEIITILTTRKSQFNVFRLYNVAGGGVITKQDMENLKIKLKKNTNDYRADYQF